MHNIVFLRKIIERQGNLGIVVGTVNRLVWGYGSSIDACDLKCEVAWNENLAFEHKSGLRTTGIPDFVKLGNEKKTLGFLFLSAKGAIIRRDPE